MASVASSQNPCARLLPWLLVCGLLAGAAAAQQVAAVRFVHLSPDAPRVDVVAGDASVLRNVEYGTTSGFVRVTPGEHTLRVFPHRLPNQDGQPEEADEDGVEQVRLEPVTLVAELEAGEFYTLLLTGFYEPPADEDRRGFLSIDVDPTEATVTVEGPRGYGHEASGDQLLRELEPGEYTVRVDAEDHQPQERTVAVRAFRTTVVSATLQREADDAEEADAEPDEVDGDDAGGDAEGDAPPMPEQPDEQAGETWDPLELQLFDEPDVALPPAGNARVRIVHASPLAPAVDVLFVREDADDRDEIVRELTFPNASASEAVPSGSGRLLVVVAGSRNPLYELSGFALEPGAVYTFFLATDPDRDRVRLVPAVSAVLRYGF